MIISRDKSLLCPPFAAILFDFEAKLSAAGLPFAMFMGLRDWQTQDELYAQGRSTPGNIVTNARGGESWHNYGLGADYVWHGPMEGLTGLHWSWDCDKSLWQKMGEVAESCGLEWGGRWRMKDLPHVQKTYGLRIQEAQELWRVGGVKRVWQECMDNGAHS